MGRELARYIQNEVSLAWGVFWVSQFQFGRSLHSPEFGLPAFWRMQRPIIFKWDDHPIAVHTATLIGGSGLDIEESCRVANQSLPS